MRTTRQPEFEQVFKTAKFKGTQWTQISVLHNWDHCQQQIQCLPSLSANCNSHRAPQLERKWVWGIVHDINPHKHYSARQDPIQTDKHKIKSTIYLPKEKLNQQSFWLLSTLIWQWLSWMPLSSVVSADFMGPLPAILDSHYCAVVWVPLFCYPRFRYSEQSTGFLFTKPGNWETHHQTVQLRGVEKKEKADRTLQWWLILWGVEGGRGARDE